MNNFVHLLWIPFFGFYDRYAGGGWPWKSSYVGRPIYYIAPCVIYFGWISHLEWVFIQWIIWRSLSWNFLYGASINPDSFQGWWSLFCRHLFLVWLSCLSAVAVQLASNNPPSNCGIVLICLVGWAIMASLLGLAWGTLGRGKDWNPQIEILRGGVFGLVIFMEGLQ